MRAIAVQPGDGEAWKVRLDWHFQSFCRDGSTTPDELWSDVTRQARQLWVLDDGDDILGAFLTEVFGKTLKTCSVTHAAGKNRHTWQHLWPALEHWAREIGCERMMAVCRPGWEPILADYGMKKTHVILERPL